MAPGFSSTTGVQIAMSRFDNIEHDKSGMTLKVGAGCLWDQVAHEMRDSGQNIVGGQTDVGVGVAGWLLGGGYSHKTNQYGLGIDNIVGYEIVLPNGEIKHPTATNDTELFNALRVWIVLKLRFSTYKHELREAGIISVSLPNSP